jgi:hypothetical protein
MCHGSALCARRPSDTGGSIVGEERWQIRREMFRKKSNSSPVLPIDKIFGSSVFKYPAPSSRENNIIGNFHGACCLAAMFCS